MDTRVVAATCLALAALVLPGCAAVPVSNARLYNINNDMLSTLHLYAPDRPYGRVTVRRPDGERLQGEFTLTGQHTPTHSVPELVKLVFNSPSPKPLDARLSGLPPATGSRSLAAAFGYKQGDVARPVAVATAVGKRTSVEIVFYTLDIQHGHGTGIAHDNHGNWYLVRLGI